MSLSLLLMKLEGLIEGQVVKRPSQHIKSPYVADVALNEFLLSDPDCGMVLAHTPALGCCGLADISSCVLMAPAKNKDNKCSHTIYLSKIIDSNDNNNIIVGIHPKLAENLVENALNSNLLSKLQFVRQYRKETTINVSSPFLKKDDSISSRFDFTGIDKDGIPFIMEVKNVPLADYEDMYAKDRRKMDFSGREFDSKVAYFPDGYRKKSADPVSPRALKHMRELTIIKRELNSKIRCLMCYVIQRTDVNRFQPSIIDPEYREAFRDAVDTGVEMITMVVHWNADGEAYFVRDDLPILTPLGKV
jgi:DNA-binding sugar fermentation-stimulating protein